MNRDLWVLYGGRAPRRVLEVLEYAECGQTPARLIPGWTGPRAPYRATNASVRLATGKTDHVPIGWLFHGTHAEAHDMLTRPYGAPRPAEPVGQLVLDLTGAAQ